MAVRIRTADETIVRATPFVFVGNNEYRMVGINAASRPSLTGGHLAVYVMHATRRRSLLLLGWQVWCCAGPSECVSWSCSRSRRR